MEYLNHPLKFIFSTVSQTGSRENCEGSYFCMNKQDGGIGGAIHRRETMMSIKVCLERQSYEIIWIIQVIIRDHRWLNDPPPPNFWWLLLFWKTRKPSERRLSAFEMPMEITYDENSHKPTKKMGGRGGGGRWVLLTLKLGREWERIKDRENLEEHITL